MFRNLREDIYKELVTPSHEFKNKSIIYRIGTFLLYYISENNKRIFDDSLLSTFGNYLHADSPEVISQRLKDLGVSYLLIDLNAATIDQDPNKILTKNYESLVSFL